MQASAAYVEAANRRVDWIIIALCVIVLSLSFILSLSDGETVALDADGSYPLPPICLFRATTGLSCPSCGLTRSFIALAHLDPETAWHQHRLGPLLFAFVLLQLPYRILRLTWPRFYGLSEKRDLSYNLGALLVFVALLIINWFIYLAETLL
jgi:hypothetical protein